MVVVVVVEVVTLHPDVGTALDGVGATVEGGAVDDVGAVVPGCTAMGAGSRWMTHNVTAAQRTHTPTAAASQRTILRMDCSGGSSVETGTAGGM